MAFAVVIAIGLGCTKEGNAQQGPDALKTVSVCDLFIDLASHSGTRVKVRGTIYSGREVFALGEKTCKKKFVTRYRVLPELVGVSEQPTGEFVWPTAIDLSSSSVSVIQGGSKTDEESIRRVLKMLTDARAAKQDTNARIDLWVTVTGLLVTKDHYDVAPDTGGALRGSGYGHLGAYPAQLVIETMTDPDVKLTKE